MLDDNIEAVHGWFTGSDISLVFTIYQNGTTRAQIEAGVASAQDITNWQLDFMLKQNLEDDDLQALIHKVTSDGGILMTSPGTGICTVGISAANTENLTDGLYYYALKRTGTRTVLAYGTARIRQGVHKAL